MKVSVERIKSWGAKGVLSVLDQGVYSGANFVLSILLARWLLPSYYGVFSIAYSVYLFAYQIHNSIIIEPMSVLGPANMHHRLSDYLRDQTRLHFIFTGLGGLVILVIGIMILSADLLLGQIIMIMSMVVPFILLPLLMRRGFYMFQKPQFALLGSVVYALVMFVSLWMANSRSKMSVYLAFPLIGLAGLVSGLVLINRIPARQLSQIPIADIWSGNWNYGMWLLYSSVLIAIAAQAQTFVVGGLLGFSDAGAFRALQNFVQPMILFFAAISALLLPSLSYDYATGKMDSLKRKGIVLLTLFLMVSACFELLLILFGPMLEKVLYEGKFSSYAPLIPLWGLVPIAAAITYVYYFLLQSIQRPKAILLGSIVWSGTSVILSLALSKIWGIAGATLSVSLGYLFAGLAFAILYHYYISEEKRYGVFDDQVMD